MHTNLLRKYPAHWRKKALKCFRQLPLGLNRLTTPYGRKVKTALGWEFVGYQFVGCQKSAYHFFCKNNAHPYNPSCTVLAYSVVYPGSLDIDS